MAAWDGPYSEILVDSLLTAGLHVSLERFEFNQQVHEFINQSLKEELKKMALINEHPLEMAVLFAIKKRNVDALLFAKHGLETVRKKLFLDSSPLLSAKRQSVDNLLELQALVEVAKYLSSPDADKQLADSEWMRLRPCLKDDLVAWDKVLCVRNLYLMREEEKESKMDTGEEGEANGSALSLAKGYVALAQASVAQANVYSLLFEEDLPDHGRK
jgi:hypothetical protein